MTTGEHAMNVREGIDFPRITCGEVVRRKVIKFVYSRPVSRYIASSKSLELGPFRREEKREHFLACSKPHTNVVVGFRCAA